MDRRGWSGGEPIRLDHAAGFGCLSERIHYVDEEGVVVRTIVMRGFQRFFDGKGYFEGNGNRGGANLVLETMRLSST